MSEEDTKLDIVLRRNLRKDLERLCEVTGQTKSEIAEIAIKEYIEKNRDKLEPDTIPGQISIFELGFEDI